MPPTTSNSPPPSESDIFDGGDTLAEVERIRQEFPETWLFIDDIVRYVNL